MARTSCTQYGPLLVILLFLTLASFLAASRDKTTLSHPSSYASPKMSDERESTALSNPPSKTTASSSSSSSKKSQDFYGAAAHEVPSGPNPESN